MNTPPYIDHLIRIHLSGEPTPPEREALQAWLAESEENLRLYQTLQKVWDEPSVEIVSTDSAQQAQQLWQRAQRSERVAKVRYYGLRTAAAILMALTVGVALYLVRFVSLERIAEDQVTLRTSPGQRLPFRLPDGSQVWLNAKSSLHYSPNGFDSLRRVTLSGEAYFEVVRDTTRRFVVVSGKLSTTALGTAFNVEAYDSQPERRVTLVEGSVRVDRPQARDRLLAPGMALSYNPSSGTASKEEVRVAEVIGWKDNVLSYQGASFGEFVTKTERWYGIDIKVQGAIPEGWSLTGYYEDVPLEYVLDDVSFGQKFTYQIADQQVTLSF